MPSLGADMEAGTLVEWLKAPGDRVSRGDIVAVVETQKGAIEIEIFEDGVMQRHLVEPGQTVPVGAPMALVNGGAPVAAAEAPAAPPPRAQVPIAPPLPIREAPVEPGRLRVSPVARRRAGELGIDLGTLRGSGLDGVVTLADVESVEAPPREPPAATPRAAMREAIAAAMSRANREIPHYHLRHTVDLAPMTAWLELVNEQRPVTERLLPGVVFLKATALALREMPELNGFWRDGGFRPGEGIHVGWAISLRGGGLIAPAILDADTLSLSEAMAAMRDLVRRARAGGLRSSEMSRATVTITSLGDNGVEAVHGVIYPPQVALIGFGRTVIRPWVVNGGVEPRPLVEISLAGDHRAGDGARGARFLNILDQLLREPERL